MVIGQDSRSTLAWALPSLEPSNIVVTVVLATQDEPAVYLSPLLPLGLLLITGAALFVEAYLAKRRPTRGATA